MSRNYHSFPEPSGIAAGKNHPDDSGRADSAAKIAPMYKPPGNINEPDCATLARFARRLIDADGKAATLDEIRSSIDLQGVDDPNGVAVSAQATLGTDPDGIVTIVMVEPGVNTMEVEVVQDEGISTSLSAEIVDDVLVVTLPTDNTGVPDTTLSTATLVAAAIDDLTEFTATASGTGDTAIGEQTTAFSGGAEASASAVDATAGTVYNQLDEDKELVAVWVSNGDGTWRNIPIGNVPSWQVLTESAYTALVEAIPSEVDANTLYFTVADPET